MDSIATAPAPKQKRSPTKRHKDTPLTERDWVHAAVDILIRENVRGIRIDALCKKLGVTKGSFYWHFEKRADLLAAMLRDWRRRMTLNVIQNLSRSGETAKDRLRKLIGLPRGEKSPAHAQVEQSIRDWGRRESTANDAVTEVDQIRFEYFTQLFLEMGFDQPTAEKRAYVAYCIMMGDSVLHRTLPRIEHDALLTEITGLLTSPPRPQP